MKASDQQKERTGRGELIKPKKKKKEYKGHALWEIKESQV